MHNDKSCCISSPTYLFFFLLRAAGSSSSLYSRGILEKGEKHMYSLQSHMGDRWAERSLRHSRALRCSEMEQNSLSPFISP